MYPAPLLGFIHYSGWNPFFVFLAGLLLFAVLAVIVIWTVRRIRRVNQSLVVTPNSSHPK